MPLFWHSFERRLRARRPIKLIFNHAVDVGHVQAGVALVEQPGPSPHIVNVPRLLASSLELFKPAIHSVEDRGNSPGAEDKRRDDRDANSEGNANPLSPSNSNFA